MQTITLKTPLKRGEKEISSVQIREPKGGELRGISLSEMAEMKTDIVLTLLPRISTPSLTEEEGEQIGGLDLMKIGAAILGVSPDTDNGSTTGNASSPKK